MKRNIIAAGNWKMNNTNAEGKELINALITGMQNIDNDASVILSPSFVMLQEALSLTADNPKIAIAAQNCHQEEKGAYTGEVSASMLANMGVQYVILGHSERRQYFSESESLLAAKVNAALKNNLKVIFCVGEPLNVREDNGQNTFVAAQLSSLEHLSVEEMKNVLIAYEPIWAIGTGKTASADQAQEMHAFIRSRVSEKFGADTANTTSILYGGSVGAANAQELFSKPDVDGGLVGGASLKAADFLAIINAG